MIEVFLNYLSLLLVRNVGRIGATTTLPPTAFFVPFLPEPHRTEPGSRITALVVSWAAKSRRMAVFHGMP